MGVVPLHFYKKALTKVKDFYEIQIMSFFSSKKFILSLIFLFFLTSLSITIYIHLTSNKQLIVSNNRIKIITNKGGNLVSSDVGYVPNVFSWGFNRHICYNPKDKNWWIFYYKSPNMKPPWMPDKSYIVYKYSLDDGITWSDEIMLEKKPLAADFTIDCDPPYISVAYGDIYKRIQYQSEILWKKGEMGKDNIHWFVSNSAMRSSPHKPYTRVIPSIVHYNGIPVISAHDQSEEGIKDGYKRAYVVIAKDKHGRSWNKDMLIYEEPHQYKPSRLSFLSLAIVKNELIALINAEQNELFITKFEGDGKWSKLQAISNLNYGGSVPEWSTVTDTHGVLHLLYPRKNGSTSASHATYNGEEWNFNTVNKEEIGIRSSSLSIDDKNNLYSVRGNTLNMQLYNNSKWSKPISVLQHSVKDLIYINTNQKIYDGKIGIAWRDGNELDPNIWFICVKMSGDKKNTRVTKCNDKK